MCSMVGWYSCQYANARIFKLALNIHLMYYLVQNTWYVLILSRFFSVTLMSYFKFLVYLFILSLSVSAYTKSLISYFIFSNKQLILSGVFHQLHCFLTKIDWVSLFICETMVLMKIITSYPIFKENLNIIVLHNNWPKRLKNCH